jgi:hypothetical protein
MKDEAPYSVFRDKCERNVAKFRNCLSNVNWYDLDDIHEPKKAYCSFFSKFNDIYNDCFPLKKVKNNKSIFKKPWLSKGLLKSVRQKNRLYKRYLNSPSVNNNLKYKRFKIKLNHSIRIAKRLYYEQQ